MALSANTALTTRNRGAMTRYTYTLKTAVTMYQHGLAVLNAAGTAKIPANETTTKFVGMVEEAPSAAGDGTITVTVVNDLDVLLPLATSVTVGMVGDAIYAVDDETGTNLNTLGPEIGALVEFVDTNSGWVRLGKKALVVAS